MSSIVSGRLTHEGIASTISLMIAIKVSNISATISGLSVYLPAVIRLPKTEGTGEGSINEMLKGYLM